MKIAKRHEGFLMFYCVLLMYEVVFVVLALTSWVAYQRINPLLFYFMAIMLMMILLLASLHSAVTRR